MEEPREEVRDVISMLEQAEAKKRREAFGGSDLPRGERERERVLCGMCCCAGLRPAQQVCLALCAVVCGALLYALVSALLSGRQSDVCEVGARECAWFLARVAGVAVLGTAGAIVCLLVLVFCAREVGRRACEEDDESLYAAVPSEEGAIGTTALQRAPI